MGLERLALDDREKAAVRGKVDAAELDPDQPAVDQNAGLAVIDSDISVAERGVDPRAVIADGDVRRTNRAERDVAGGNDHIIFPTMAASAEA
jgi:hypothetical protein